MGTAGRWAAIREEFSGWVGRARLVLAVAGLGAFLAFTAAAILVERPHRSPTVQALLLAGQVLGFAFSVSLRPHPAKWLLATGFGAGAISALVRML